MRQYAAPLLEQSGGLETLDEFRRLADTEFFDTADAVAILDSFHEIAPLDALALGDAEDRLHLRLRRLPTPAAPVLAPLAAI